MAQLYFYYGAMNSSKSANLLMVAHNYEQQRKNVLIFNSSLDTRSSRGLVESRVGISHSCINIFQIDNIYRMVRDYLNASDKDIDCILIEEAQFLSEKQVQQLVEIVDNLDIPVMCYGLKNTYVDGELFEGSKALLYYADKLGEIKTICTYCNKKATMNLRISNGKPIYIGDTIKCGDIKDSEDYYIPTCRYHYHNPDSFISK